MILCTFRCLSWLNGDAEAVKKNFIAYTSQSNQPNLTIAATHPNASVAAAAADAAVTQTNASEKSLPIQPERPNALHYFPRHVARIVLPVI